ncbi:MAG TPA: hypothetical protein VK731_14295, partial [Candidatus Cybelea sp.]|nr:hypothetical protein [Candidatus Cybelea sp.]
ELLDTYNSLLHDACRHADPFWKDCPTNSNSGFWDSGHSDENGFRHIEGMTLATAALLKYSSALTENERAEYKRKELAAFRFVTATHVTGPRKCTDGKHWGDAWQSAMWTADLAFSAWLIWDELDDGLRKDFERVVAHEADRFLTIRAPAGSFNDTKAEENGWDLTCIALAGNMFPEHPHAAAWKKKAVEYMINTLSTPEDQDDQTVVDGRPVSEWFTGANLHPDFTLENHGFFHPSYIGCSCYFLTETAMYFTLGHQPIPAADTHHLMDTWRMYEGMLLPNGEAAYPQGMDWDLHGTPYLSLYAALASYQKDPMAAHLEEVNLQYMRAWQVKENGDLALPGSPYGFGRHAVTAGLATYAFLAHKIFGPPTKELTASEAASIGQGVNAHDLVGVVTQRTGDKFASFSWSNRVMGLVVPIGPGHEGNPDFTAPVTDGLVGEFVLGPKDKPKTVVADHSWKKTADSFETTGTLLMNQGQLKQTLQMTSLGGKTVVYQDRVVALTNVTVAQEHGVPFGIENDSVNGGTRLLSYQDGELVFDERNPRPSMAIPGSWANVDGRLGVIMVAGSGMSYSQAMNYAPGISVREDILYSSFSNHPKSYAAGDEVAHRIAVIFVEVKPRETAALAQSIKIENQQPRPILRFQTPEGTEAKIPLL